MLKKRNLLFLIIFSFVLVSCGKFKGFGLTPGYYYFQTCEGYLPTGWSFDFSSCFEFKKSEVDDPTKTDVLQDGQWQMTRCEPNEKGYFDYDSNYIMQWYNTPFNSLSPARVGGSFLNREGPNIVMAVRSYSVNKWENYIDYFLYCIIGCVDNDYSKRKVTISISFFLENGERGDKTRIVFSM